MAQRILNEEVRKLRKSVEPVIIGEEAFRQEFGFPMGDMCMADVREIVYGTFGGWFEAGDRAGVYAFEKLSNATFWKRKSGREPHLAVFISDPDVRFEFKMRFG